MNAAHITGQVGAPSGVRQLPEPRPEEAVLRGRAAALGTQLLQRLREGAECS